MTRTVLSVVLILGVSHIAGGQPTVRRDGHWWRQQEKSSRALYVAGFLDGYTHGALAAQGETILQLRQAKPGDQKCAEAALAGAGIATTRLPAGTAGSLETGVDGFYSDSRNNAILLGDALEFVADQIRGLPEREVRERLEALRKSAADR